MHWCVPYFAVMHPIYRP